MNDMTLHIASKTLYATKIPKIKCFYKRYLLNM